MAAGREPIFDHIDRTVTSAARHTESSFDFLNRIAGTYWAYPRQLMQGWADHIAEPSDYYELRQRFRSRDDYEFRSAFLELYLHECLTRAGYRPSFHPEMPGRTRRPDFFAERETESLYVEAIAPGVSPQAKAAAQRRAVLLDVVNGLGDPNFLLAVLDIKDGGNQPKSRLLRESLRAWLQGLDPDSVSDTDSRPERTWQNDGWEATFQAIPIRAEMRGLRPARSIGFYGHHPVTWIDNAPAIRKALTNKHHAYGDLDAPFLIAVGTYIFDPDRWHSTNALWGHGAIECHEASDGNIVTRDVRQPDGYFGVPGAWQHRNVSGVLLVNQLMPERVQRAETTLWKHPDPFHALPRSLGFPSPTLELRGSRFVEEPAPVVATSFFGLPESWPPGDPWPDEA